MQYTEAKTGRVFVIRLEDGDILHESIEQVARENGVSRGYCLALGGADDGSKIVVGPEDGRAQEIQPMTLKLANVHESAGVGTIFPDEDGQPVLHMHAVFGRDRHARAGCVRAGVKVWLVSEVVLVELTGCSARRVTEPESKFKLLSVKE